MKTLNDTLREEFSRILTQDEFTNKIKFNKLDTNLINKAFDVLLEFKSDSDLRDNARRQFENFLINHFKTKS